MLRGPDFLSQRNVTSTFQIDTSRRLDQVSDWRAKIVQRWINIPLARNHDLMADDRFKVTTGQFAFADAIEHYAGIAQRDAIIGPRLIIRLAVRTIRRSCHFILRIDCDRRF